MAIPHRLGSITDGSGPSEGTHTPINSARGFSEGTFAALDAVVVGAVIRQLILWASQKARLPRSMPSSSAPSLYAN